MSWQKGYALVPDSYRIRFAAVQSIPTEAVHCLDTNDIYEDSQDNNDMYEHVPDSISIYEHSLYINDMYQHVQKSNDMYQHCLHSNDMYQHERESNSTLYYYSWNSKAITSTFLTTRICSRVV
ncbi:hypothetical protein BJ508DRAFT_315344 [Ascobolus immersus RN42]|uniref:Uncharacterized protein n=1 Tax=Ascobolus immersus RN42 TaxID=1160509 RepID=A0A3N4HBB7_ASCIM|nr:hypothetical protein BJ508DRAFT_315344 [Ascobolus immersus RN42]